jgi:hypothetical protein
MTTNKIEIALKALADALEEADALYELAAKQDKALAVAHAHILNARLGLARQLLDGRTYEDHPLGAWPLGPDRAAILLDLT